MAAVADVQTVNITINDIALAVPKGEMIVESAKRIGIEIPIFCYHPRLLPVGMCRMCLVEMGSKGPDGTVRMFPKPQTACSLPATEGLVIVTDSERVHADRRGVLEFLLINHPLDCPICDRGGECPLQNNTLFYGPSTSRFIEVKRHAPKAFPLSKYVTLDLERCIQCGRCVRFTEEISGDAQLAFMFRGASMQPSTFEMRDFGSKFSGNVIEICPVGALTNTEYRFRARPWDLETRPAICTNCGNGCNVYFDYRGGQMVRINGRTNEHINEEWTCDKGKFRHEYYNSESRLRSVLIRSGDNLRASDWATAYHDIASHFVGAGDKAALLGGGTISNEDGFMLCRLFARVFGSKKVEHRTSTYLPPAPLSKRLGQPLKASLFTEIEERKALLVFGTSLADDAPMAYLRTRKAWFQHGAKVIVANAAPTDADSFAHVLLTYKPGSEAALAEGLATAAGIKGANAQMTPAKVEQLTGVPAARLQEAAEALKDSHPAIITTKALYEAPDASAVEESLGSLALALEGSYDSFALTANGTGAELLGLTSSGGLEILKACAAGKVKSLWLAGIDPFEHFADRELVTKALEKVEFLVVQGVIENEATGYASLVLPMTAPAEADGTWTNIEGRVQRFQPVIPSKGVSKPAWLVATELISRLKPEPPVFSASGVMDLIAKEVPAFASVSYAAIGPDGIVL